MNRMLKEQHDVVIEKKTKGAKNAVDFNKTTPSVEAKDVVLDEKDWQTSYLR